MNDTDMIHGSRHYIKKSFSSWKDNFLPYLLISLEAFVITSIGQIVLLPFLLLADLSAISLNFRCGSLHILDLPETTLLLIALSSSITVLIILAFIFGLILPGIINSVYKTKDGVKISFGDVYRFGKREWLDHTGLFLIDLLVLIFLLILSMIVIGVVIAIIGMIAPILSLILSIFASIFITISLLIIPIILILLSFIIKYRERETNIRAVNKTFDFVMNYKGFFMGLSLYLLLALVISFLIPFLNILTTMILVPFLLTVLIIFYEEKAHPQDMQDLKRRYRRRERPNFSNAKRSGSMKRRTDRNYSLNGSRTDRGRYR